VADFKVLALYSWGKFMEIMRNLILLEVSENKQVLHMKFYRL